MTIEELYNELLKIDVSDDKYYLHGLFGSTDDNDKIALTVRKGKYTNEYEIYFKERGEKNSSQIFTTESEACQYFLQKVQDYMIYEKAQNVVGLNGMTVNERLNATGLMDEFEGIKKKNKSRAAQILRILRVDGLSIKNILK